MIDSVQSSRFITQKQAKDLTDKLKAKASRFDRVLLDRRCYVPNRVRSSNDSIFYHLDDLHTAIANDWRISFKYFYFTPKKNRAYYKKGEYYHASPYVLANHIFRDLVCMMYGLRRTVASGWMKGGKAMLFLEEFWNGNIAPGEGRYHPKKEYSMASGCTESCDNFIEGFRMGARMMIDVLEGSI